MGAQPPRAEGALRAEQQQRKRYTLGLAQTANSRIPSP